MHDWPPPSTFISGGEEGAGQCREGKKRRRRNGRHEKGRGRSKEFSLLLLRIKAKDFEFNLERKRINPVSNLFVTSAVSRVWKNWWRSSIGLRAFYGKWITGQPRGHVPRWKHAVPENWGWQAGLCLGLAGRSCFLSSMEPSHPCSCYKWDNLLFFGVFYCPQILAVLLGALHHLLKKSPGFYDEKWCYGLILNGTEGPKKRMYSKVQQEGRQEARRFSSPQICTKSELQIAPWLTVALQKEDHDFNRAFVQ